MALKKLKLSVPTGNKPENPLDIFKTLTLRGSIENIWEPQAEALKGWHKLRAQTDVVVQMNTGGGKTLVGLLMAQSLVNEMNKRVLYIVANNQLVEQTAKRAHEIGLQPATRYRSDWTNQEAFQSAETFCITNYAAVFNGFSTFADKDVAALIFDDAHVAEGTIRDQFTIKVPRKSALFAEILKLYRPHFVNTIGAARLDDIVRENEATLLFVPMFVVWKHAQELRKLFVDAGVAGDANMKYAWNYLADHLNHCCVLISSSTIEISPPVTPLHALPYFADSVRRVYLTATLPSDSAFARTYGLAQPEVVRPGGKSGDAQRLFVFAPGETDKVQRVCAIKLVESRKACVISPSTNKAAQWVPPSVVFEKDSGHEGIETFCKSTEPQLLGLVARYDGIDLAGDACRVLILDRLPKGELLFDRFIDEGVRIDSIRLGHTATRVVQAIGRIFRSNTDHGAVILVGPDLLDWIRNPSNRAFLPELIQKQVSLGIELTKKVKLGEVTWGELLEAVISGDPNWDELYNEHIAQFEVNAAANLNPWFPPLLLEERKAFEFLWDGNYGHAIASFAQIARIANKHDRRLGAWYQHLEGCAHLCADDRASAVAAFTAASLVRSELGRPSEHRDKMFKPPKADSISKQSLRLASDYRKRRVNMLSEIESVLVDLEYNDDTKPAENAMRQLGTLLGLESSRPDDETDTGPDVLWCGAGEIEAWGFELKTGKAVGTEYSKSEISQSHDHRNWLAAQRPGKPVRISIVGRESRVSALANPDKDLDVIELEGFREIANAVKNMFESIEAGDKNALEDAFESWLRHYGLLWPMCVLALPNKLAIELKSE